jgi:hypothetical protein
LARHIHEAGEPLTLNELRTFVDERKPFAGKEPAWLGTLPALPSVPSERDPWGRPRPDMLGESRKAVKSGSRALEVLHDAANAEADLGLPLDMTLWAADDAGRNPVSDRLTDAGRLLAAEARVRTADRDAPGAITAIRSLLWLEDGCRNAPGAVPLLLRVAALNSACRSIVAAVPLITSGDAARLEARLSAASLDGDLLNSLVAERANIYAAFDESLSWSWKGLTLPDGRGAHLRFSTELVDAARAPWPEAFRRSADVREESLRWAMTAPFSSWFPRRLPALSQVEMMRMLFYAVGRSKAQVALTRLAIAAERRRRDLGVFPAAAGELTPRYLTELPQDPFTGKPLSYFLTASELLIYSVGSDRKNDGGQEGDNGWGDIVVRISAGETKPATTESGAGRTEGPDRTDGLDR